MIYKKMKTLFVSAVIVMSLVACQSTSEVTTNNLSVEAVVESPVENSVTVSEETSMSSSEVEAVESSMLNLEAMFTDRDINQEADLSEAQHITLENNSTHTLVDEGVYVLTGKVTNTVVIVEADDDSKVQIVLDGVSITNESVPAIYVKSGDKVFVTTSNSTNTLQVTGVFDSNEDYDAVIYSKSDLVLNGLGTLDVISMKGVGVLSKDDLKVTGGTVMITSDDNGLEANDSIRIYQGVITILTNSDGIHSENDEEPLLGYIYIKNGLLKITAADDAIHGNSIVQIDGGTIDIDSSAEGIEATFIQINQGVISIYATDDGINATSLSDLDVIIEVNGGYITIVMADGDTDGFDANGDIYINGGTINVTAVSSFDADGTAVLNGGTVIVNGTEVKELPESQMGKKKH